METTSNNYKIAYIANNKELTPFFSEELHNVTDEFAKAYTAGVCAGMYCHFKKPCVKLYKQQGERYVLIHRIN